MNEMRVIKVQSKSPGGRTYMWQVKDTPKNKAAIESANPAKMYTTIEKLKERGMKPMIDESRVQNQPLMRSASNQAKQTIQSSFINATKNVLSIQSSTGNILSNEAPSKSLRVEDLFDKDAEIINYVEERILNEVFDRPPLYNNHLEFKYRTPDLVYALFTEIAEIINDEMETDDLNATIIENTWNHYKRLYTEYKNPSKLSCGPVRKRLSNPPQHLQTLKRLDFISVEPNQSSVGVPTQSSVKVPTQSSVVVPTQSPVRVPTQSVSKKATRTKKPSSLRVEDLFNKDKAKIFDVEHRLLEEVFQRPPLFNHKLDFMHRSPDKVHSLFDEIANLINEEMETWQLTAEIIENTWRYYKGLYIAYKNASQLKSGSGRNRLPYPPKHLETLKQLDVVSELRSQVSSLSAEGFPLIPPKNRKKDDKIGPFIKQASSFLSNLNNSSSNQPALSSSVLPTSLADADPNMAFFYGILPHFNRLKDKDRIELQWNIMNDLKTYIDRDIRESRYF